MILSMESNEKQQLGPLGCVRHSHGLVVLHLLSIVLLAGLLVTVLVQGFKDPSSSANEKIYKQLMQLGVGVDSLCRPCPWEWTFFHRRCYYFSKCQRNWNDSVAACQEVDAQLVTVESDEEKTFLDVLLKNKEPAWMGLSDLKQEGMWQWVDGSPLSDSFRKYWKKGQPNNLRNQDCVELTLKGWNDNNCDNKKFWICKKLETSYSSK